MRLGLFITFLGCLLGVADNAKAGGINTDWVQMTPRASSPIPSARGGLYTSSVTGRPTLVDSSGNSFTIGVGSSWVASAGPPPGAVIGDCWRDTTDGNKVYCKESSGIVAQRSDVASPGSFGSGAINLVLASPASGSSGPVTLRALVAADLPVVSKSKGGWGADVSTGLTTNYVGIVAGGAMTVGPLLAAALPSNIDVAKLGTGSVSNAVFGYIANLTSDVQAQINAITAAAVALSNATPAAVGTAGPGVATTSSRSDHVHAHGNQAGGSLHADAVAAGSAGFLSGSDKAKLDALPAALTLPLSKANGGFGQAVDAGLTNGYFAKVVSGAISIAAILAGDLPTGIDAAKIAAGTVTSTVFGYLANVTSDIQAQLDLLLPASSTKLPPAPTGANKLLYDTGTAYAETSACSSASTVLVGGSPPACAAVPDAALSANICTLTGTQTLTNKTVNCANNTCSNVSLTAAVTGALPVANGGTNSNTALGNNRAIVSSGGKLVETASACGAGTVLGGGSPPDCIAAATLSTSLTTPLVTSTSQLSLNAASGSNVTIGVNGVVTATLSASGVTFAQPLGMGTQKITGTVQGATAGEVVVYPVPYASLAQPPVGVIQCGVGNAAMSASTTYYCSGVGVNGAVASNTIYVASGAKTLKNLASYCGTGAGTATITVQTHNGSWSDTSMTTTSTSGTPAATDTTHTANISNLNLVGVKVVTNGAWSGGSCVFAIEVSNQ